MLQWLHLVSFLGVKDMGITDIKRVLRLYFIQQLAQDELVRSGNMLDADFSHISTTEGNSTYLFIFKYLSFTSFHCTK